MIPERPRGLYWFLFHCGANANHSSGLTSRLPAGRSVKTGTSLKKKISVKSYGVKKAYARTKGIVYTPAMMRWLNNQEAEINKYLLAREFNKRFSTKITKDAIRSKFSRIKGTKK